MLVKPRGYQRIVSFT